MRHSTAQPLAMDRCKAVPALGSLAATCECLRDPQTSTYVGFRARKAGAYESPLLADRSYM